MTRSRSWYKPVWLLVVLTAMMTMWAQVLLLDEEEEGEGLVGSYDGTRKNPPPGLLGHEAEYLDTVHELILGYSKAARRRLRRHYTLALTAVISASAVPAVVAANAPGWSVAALGALAAASQSCQQLLQDQRIGAESHAMAVVLGSAVRRFRFESVLGDDLRRRQVFEGFVETVEELRESRGTALIELLRSSELPSLKASDNAGTLASKGPGSGRIGGP